MKIITWNCNLNFSKKFENLEAFDSDIIIIQECERLKTDFFPNHNFFWTGRIESKGLGVQFSFPKKLIERIGINVMQRDYKLMMIEFFKKRDDEIYNVSFDLRDLKILSRNIKVRLVYEKSNSNIDIYKRDGWSILFIRQL